MGLAERASRALRFSAAPDPHQPSQQRDPAEARRVVQDPDPAAVADRQHAARRAGRLQLTRLDRQHQTLLVVDLHVEDVHVGNIEDRIGPGAPARTRATHRVRHRRGFRVGSLVASDPEGPDALNLGSTRPCPRQPTHAQIRRARQTPSSVPDLEQLASAAVPLGFLPSPEDYTGHYVQLASRAKCPCDHRHVVACDGGLDVRGLGGPRAANSP